MRRLLTLLVFIFAIAAANADSNVFSRHFSDSTLRLDYIFSGDAHEQHIALDKLCQSPRWYGKTQRMTEVPVEGNGTITVRLHASGEVIYRQSFSTLFQEWLTYPEAQHTQRAFQNCFLVPMPLHEVDVTVELRNNRRQPMVQMTHTVRPDDILIRHIGERNITPYDVIQSAADTTRCLHIAFVAEGYTADEMPTFLADAREATDAIFAHEPFASAREHFNIIAVQSVSAESGPSEPSRGIWHRTALSSHFDTFYSDRYLTTLALQDLHDVLAGVPYEHIIVLVNTEKYGGGGILNSYNLSMTHHKMFRPVVVHEFGHSLAGLADEYAYDTEEVPMYPHDVEPWEPNITTLVDFRSKWDDLGIGFVEGAGYSPRGVWRPTHDCRMRTNTNPDFCPVCRRAIQRLIDFYTK